MVQPKPAGIPPLSLALLLLAQVVAARAGTGSSPPRHPRTAGEVAAAAWQDDSITLKSFGNHRVRLRCPGNVPAVLATVEWRRPDDAPQDHGVYVTASGSSAEYLRDVVVRNVTRRSGAIAFSTEVTGTGTAASTGQDPHATLGEFYLYWLPYTKNHLGQWGALTASYDKPQATADPAWLAAHVTGKRLPACTVEAYEARDRFNAFTAMEVMATAAEMADVAAAAHQAPFVLFSEDREHPIRDFERLP